MVYISLLDWGKDLAYQAFTVAASFVKIVESSEKLTRQKLRYENGATQHRQDPEKSHNRTWIMARVHPEWWWRRK